MSGIGDKGQKKGGDEQLPDDIVDVRTIYICSVGSA